MRKRTVGNLVTVFSCGGRKKVDTVVPKKLKCKCGVKYLAGETHKCEPPCACGASIGNHYLGCEALKPPERFPGKERVYG
jgi:hypothetical protein